VQLINLQGQPISTFAVSGKEIANGRIEALRFSPDGQRIATVIGNSLDGSSFYSPGSRFVHLWDLQGNQLDVSEKIDLPVEDIEFSPDGQRLVVNMRFNTLLWTPNPLQPTIFSGQQGKVVSMQLSPDRQHFATQSADDTIRVWNRQGQLLSEIKSQGIAAEFKKMTEIKFPPGKIKQLFFLTNEQVILSYPSYSWQRWITEVWDLSGQQQHFWSINAVYRPYSRGRSVPDQLAVSPDGQSMVLPTLDQAGQNNFQIWSLAGQAQTQLANPTSLRPNELNDLKFSPDGRYILAPDFRLMSGIDKAAS
jgi:WD40 repeat protein